MKSLVCICCIIVACSSWAENKVQRIAFETRTDIERTCRILKMEGINRFVELACAQGVSAPEICSKYWVDRQTNGNVRSVAVACRKFGQEFVRQVDSLAVEIFKNADKGQECSRLDKTLRIAEWIGAAGKFENYRIALRAEEAATMDLLRIIMDFSVSDDRIVGLISRFTTLRKSASVRAQILFEESNGAFDARRLARKASDTEDGFADEWRVFRSKALRHYGNNKYEYSKAVDFLKKEEDRYAFFMDDTPGSPHCDSTHWDCKVHKQICVYRTQAEFLAPIIKVFRFRQLVGKFPDVNVPAGASEYETYQDWYAREYDWVFRQYRIGPSTVAAYYLKYKHNSYTDSQTWWLISEADQQEIVRTNMLVGP